MRPTARSKTPRARKHRALENIERGLRTYDKKAETLLDEYGKRDENGEFVLEDTDGNRVYRTPRGLERERSGGERHVMLAPGAPPEVQRRVLMNLDFVKTDPEAYAKEHEKELRQEIEVDLYLIPEAEFEKESALDLDALQDFPMRTIRQLLVKGNQGAFKKPGEEKKESPGALAKV